MYKKIISSILIALFSSLSCYDGLLDTYDNSKAYNLRDRGPAGGWIFYINPNWKTDGWRYMEAAPEDQISGTTMQWSDPVNTPIGATAQGVAIGTGKTNTTAIANKAGLTNSAAKVCYNLIYNGYSDWFLPSKDELWQMCWNLHGRRYNTIDPPNAIINPVVPAGGVGGFSGVYYWSSSEDIPVNDIDAWGQHFGTGLQQESLKVTTRRVRAIRAF